MATAPSTMQRFELKYVLTPEQLSFLLKNIEGKMKVDQYGLTSILSLYFDTPDYRLIRASLEKPPFKEKIRLRSYGVPKDDSTVYLELKRKAKGYVYKRRVASKIKDVMSFMHGEADLCAEGQIAREIAYFRDYYDTLVPSCLIIVERTAYYEIDGFTRLTVDLNPRYRIDDLNMSHGSEGVPLLGPGMAILEIKVNGAMPLWLSKVLSEGLIYKRSFSKYGYAYLEQLEKLKRAERI